MKTTLLAIFFCAGAVTPLFATDTNVLNNEKAQVSYAIGMSLGYGWKQHGVDVDNDIVLRGLKDSQGGGQTLMSMQDMRDTLTEFQKSFALKQQKIHNDLAAKNEQEGESFLAQNKTQPGIVTLPDGLQYKIITDGNGAMPTSDDTVIVKYRGTLIDGTEFDSSAKSPFPAQFQVSRVIPGWGEALTHMKAGSKWQIFIPSSLAYGERGGRGIPPNSTLIFDVDLLSVQHQEPGQPPVVSKPLTSNIIKVPSLDEMKKGAKVEVIKPDETTTN